MIGRAGWAGGMTSGGERTPTRNRSVAPEKAVDLFLSFQPQPTRSFTSCTYTQPPTHLNSPSNVNDYRIPPLGPLPPPGNVSFPTPTPTRERVCPLGLLSSFPARRGPRSSFQTPKMLTRSFSLAAAGPRPCPPSRPTTARPTPRPTTRVPTRKRPSTPRGSTTQRSKRPSPRSTTTRRARLRRKSRRTKSHALLSSSCGENA